MVVKVIATEAVPLIDPLVARTVADPGPPAGALYRPVPSTLPTPPLSTLHVNAALIGLLNWSNAEAENAWVCPSATVGVPGVTTMLVRVAFTVTFTVLVVV